MHDLTADLVVSFSLSHINFSARGASLLVLVGAAAPQEIRLEWVMAWWKVCIRRE